MIIIIPPTITNAMITANTAVNADADYVPATTYSAGVKVTYGNFIYLSLQAGNTGHQPDLTASAAWWSLIGSSNKWAMFDDEVQTQSTASNTLSTTIRASYINSISCVNITASSVDIEVKKGATVAYTKTIDLFDYSTIVDWTTYFFSEHDFQTEFSLTDLPSLPDVDIKITVNKTTSTVGIGKIIIGAQLDVGLEEYNLKREGIDYTQVNTDPFGVTTLTKRSYARKYSTTAIMKNTKYDYVSKKLDSIASVPVLCIGGNGFKSTLTVYGLVTYSIILEHLQVSRVAIDVRGLI